MWEEEKKERKEGMDLLCINFMGRETSGRVRGKPVVIVWGEEESEGPRVWEKENKEGGVLVLCV